MKHYLPLLLILLSSVFPVNAHISEENEALIDSLEYYISNIQEYRNRRNRHIDDLKAEYSRSARGEKRSRIAEKIGNEYLLDALDSAVMYLQLGIDEINHVHGSEYKDHLKLRLLSMLPSVGIEIEAKEYFDEYDPTTMPRSLRQDYWLTATQLYHTIGTTYPEGCNKDYYKLLTLIAIDSLRTYYPAESAVATYLSGQRYLLEGDRNLAAANFVEAIPRLGSNPELRDFALKNVAEHYSNQPENRQKYLNFLLKRAVFTLNRGLIRARTLADVGEELYNSGNKSLGLKCIDLAIKNRNNSYQRPLQDFDRTKYYKYFAVDENFRRLMLIITLIVLAIISGVLGFYAAHFRKKLKNKNKELSDNEKKLANIIDETVRVNRNLTDLTFLSMEQLRDFNVHVYRKLKAGQTKDLYEDVDSGKYQTLLQEKFFEVFDTGFLNAFPDFVDKLNLLLLPGKELRLLPENRLSPELRIAAFLKLGVTDSSRLSKALDLSLNTIYTYRNRLRGRAADRENFEKNLLELA